MGNNPITLRHVAGGIIGVLGILLIVIPGILTSWSWWNETIGVLLLLSAFFVLIGGR
ncbi:MAG: hypothetical protein ABIG20_02995 [archaeon]